MEFFQGSSLRGIIQNESTGLQVTAVCVCVRVLAEAIVGLPVHICKASGKGKNCQPFHKERPRLLGNGAKKP